MATKHLVFVMKQQQGGQAQSLDVTYDGERWRGALSLVFFFKQGGATYRVYRGVLEHPPNWAQRAGRAVVDFFYGTAGDAATQRQFRKEVTVRENRFQIRFDNGRALDCYNEDVLFFFRDREVPEEINYSYIFRKATEQFFLQHSGFNLTSFERIRQDIGNVLVGQTGRPVLAGNQGLFDEVHHRWRLFPLWVLLNGGPELLDMLHRREGGSFARLIQRCFESRWHFDEASCANYNYVCLYSTRLALRDLGIRFH